MARHLPLLLRKTVGAAQTERQIEAQEFESRVRKQGNVTCSAGCSHCCYYPVTISILEGISLYQWLREHHLWTTKLKEKCEQTKDQTWDLAPEVWLLAMIPCPLLTEENRCLAYEARPFLCRTLFSREDPYLCHPHRISGTPVHRDVDVELFWSSEKAFLKQHDLRHALLPISVAVLMGEKIVNGEIEIEEANSTLMKELT
jgi:Fe-S-cluster containining protein